MEAPSPLRAFALLSWAHNILLIQKLKHLPTRLWYAQQTLEQGWSRDTLTAQIKNRAHERQGAAVTNFASTLPEVHANLAQGLLKDPYLFDFLGVSEKALEREIEGAMVRHVTRLLMELGEGFAFAGRQVHLEVDGEDFYVDLLFYNYRLHASWWWNSRAAPSSRNTPAGSIFMSPWSMSI